METYSFLFFKEPSNLFSYKGQKKIQKLREQNRKPISQSLIAWGCNTAEKKQRERREERGERGERRALLL